MKKVFIVMCSICDEMGECTDIARVCASEKLAEEWIEKNGEDANEYWIEEADILSDNGKGCDI